MKKILSFLLAGIMVLSLLPGGMLPAQEVTAASPEDVNVTLLVIPSLHGAAEENAGINTLSAGLCLVADKAFTMGSLAFTAAPETGVTLSYTATGAQIPVELSETSEGELLFTWLFDKAQTDSNGAVITPSTEIALQANVRYWLGRITLNSADAVSIADANLEGVLAGLFDSDEENGTRYDVQVAVEDTYNRAGHDNNATVWKALDDAAAKALTQSNVENNTHYYLTEDVTMTANAFTSTGFANKTFTICLNGYTLNGGGGSRIFRMAGNVNITICDCQKFGTVCNTNASGVTPNSGNGAIAGLIGGTNALNMYDVKVDGKQHTAGASTLGGAFYIATSQSTLTMEDCTIKNFAAKNGSAIYSVTANSYSGTIELTDCKILNNYATNQAAIYCTGGNTACRLTRCEFTGNTASGAGGSVTYNESSTLMFFDSCKITDNHGADGAVYPSSTSAVVLSGDTVIKNNTNNHGASRNIYIPTPTNSLVTTGYLNLNGLTDGADISIYTGSLKTDANKLLREYTTGVQTSWNDSWVYYENLGSYMHYENRNASFLQGQRAHVAHDNDTWTAITGTSDISKLYSGGKFYLAANIGLSGIIDMGQSNAQNVSITLCLNGYTLRASKTSRIFRISNGCSVTVCDCTAHTDETGYHAGKMIPGSIEGGAVGMYYGKGLVNKTEFTLEDGIIDGTGITSAYRAPAIMASGYSGATITINGGEIRNCSTTYVGTSSSPGSGAIHLLYQAKLTINDGSFYNNTTVENGGVICAEQGSGVTITDGKFYNNTAQKHGGAIYISCGANNSEGQTLYSTLSITGGTFNNNTAGYQGGAIYINATGNETNISKASFNGNATNCADITSGKYGGGGAIRVADGELNINKCTFEGNTSKKIASAIYSTTDDGLNMTDCVLTGNEAKQDGTLYIAKSSVNTLTNCVFTGNIVNTVGGSATNNETSSTLILDNCTITDNIGKTTSAECGGTYTSGTSELVLKGATVIQNNKITDGTERNVFIKVASASSTVAGRGMLNVDGLCTGAKVGVSTSTSDVRATADALVQIHPDGGVQTDWNKSWITYENSSQFVDRENDVFTFVAMQIAQVGTENYGTLSDAMTDAVAADTVVKLTGDVMETVAIPAGETVQLDLNGNNVGKLTSTEETTLLVADSTLSYDSTEPVVIPASAIGAGVTIPESYKVGNRRYVAIENGENIEIHRVQLTVTAKTLRPRNTGVGVKVKFNAAESILTEGYMKGFGMQFKVTDGETVIREEYKLPMGVEITGDSEMTVVIENFVESAQWATYTVTATPYITLESGETVEVEGTPITVNFKDMVLYADANYDGLSDVQKQAVSTMCNGAYKSVFASWGLQKIAINQ